MSEPTTFVFDERGERLGWINGHMPSGFVWNVSHHGKAYRLDVAETDVQVARLVKREGV